MPFRLRAGDTGPVQQSSRTCASACLTVARMLLDVPFASWVRTGEPRLPGLPHRPTLEARFAAYERLVQQRTNALFGAPGWFHVPWPRALGTPPWGARREIENGASRAGTRYCVGLLRPDRRRTRVSAYDRLVDVVADGEPGLLYVGSRLLPRHVVLVLPGDGDRSLDVYDPADGQVRHLRRDEYVARRLRLSGWDVPWFAVAPNGLRRAPVTEGKLATNGETSLPGWAREANRV